MQDSWGNPHPLLEWLHLVTWKVSGNRQCSVRFWTNHLSSRVPAGGRAQRNPTAPVGENGVVGAGDNINPMALSIADVVQFLTEEFQQGKQYSTLNSYRSVLSATIPPIKG